LLDNSKEVFWNSNDDSDDKGTPHILNNLSAGAGVSFRIRNKYRLEIEPTLRLPLEELGEQHKSFGSLFIYFNFKIPL